MRWGVAHVVSPRVPLVASDEHARRARRAPPRGGGASRAGVGGDGGVPRGRLPRRGGSRRGHRSSPSRRASRVDVERAAPPRRVSGPGGRRREPCSPREAHRRATPRALPRDPRRLRVPPGGVARRRRARAPPPSRRRLPARPPPGRLLRTRHPLATRIRPRARPLPPLRRPRRRGGRVVHQGRLRRRPRPRRTRTPRPSPTRPRLVPDPPPQHARAIRLLATGRHRPRATVPRRARRASTLRLGRDAPSRRKQTPARTPSPSSAATSTSARTRTSITPRCARWETREMRC